jgi:zinc/manganese transport system ATP-binding protein
MAAPHVQQTPVAPAQVSAPAARVPERRLAAPSGPATAVRLHGVWATRGDRVALEDVNLEIPAGRLTAVVGPNGAGKSTLLEVLAGRLAPSRGRVEFDPLVGKPVAWLPQTSTLDTGFPVTVLDLAMLGHWSRLGAFGRARREHVAAAVAALERVGLAASRDRLIGELSAGQLQRLLFARLSLQDARLVLLDEPFAAVDEATTEVLLAELRRWRTEGRGVVVVTHDLAPVRSQFDHVVLLARRVVASGPPSVALAPAALDAARRGAWALS